jgi:hypothetical protein
VVYLRLGGHYEPFEGSPWCVVQDMQLLLFDVFHRIILIVMECELAICEGDWITRVNAFVSIFEEES